MFVTINATPCVPIDGDAIRARLRNPLAAPLRVFGIVTSTMDEAKSWIRQGAPHGAAVVAAGQTAGRGRPGRRWESPAGLGVYLSVICKKNLSPPAPPSLLAGVAVSSAVSSVTGLTANLKWPNDLILRGAKIGGILIETHCGYYNIGVGVNLYQQPEDLSAAAAYPVASLSLAGASVDPNVVIAAIIDELRAWFATNETGQAANVLAAWRARDVTVGRRVRTGGDPAVVGLAETVLDNGALVIRDDEGRRHTISAGDVFFFDPDPYPHPTPLFPNDGRH